MHLVHRVYQNHHDDVNFLKTLQKQPTYLRCYCELCGVHHYILGHQGYALKVHGNGTVRICMLDHRRLV